MGNRKNFLLGVLGVFSLVLGLWIIQTPKAEGVETKGEFVRIKIDGDGGIAGDKKDLWHAFITDNKLFDEFNLGQNDYDSTYVCGLLLTDEDGGIGADDHDYIVWTRKGTILGKKTDIKDDADEAGDYYPCCSESNMTQNACTIETAGNCDVNILNDTNKVFQKDYFSTMELNMCDENLESPCTGTKADCCKLLSDPSGLTYAFGKQILCGDDGKWHRCDDENACGYDGKNNYACNSGVWDKCSADCTNGACAAAAANQLYLGITADPNPVLKSKSSNVKITVKKGDGTAVDGASISASVDCGNLSPTSGTTNSSGEFTSTFTAPATAGSCAVSATATKSGYTAGNSWLNIQVAEKQWTIVDCSNDCAMNCSSKVGTTFTPCGTLPPCISKEVSDTIKERCGSGSGIMVGINESCNTNADCTAKYNSNFSCITNGTYKGYCQYLCSKSDVQCSGGVYYTQCYSSKPSYCGVNANCSKLEKKDNCGVCGCPNISDTCDVNGSCSTVAPPPPPPPPSGCDTDSDCTDPKHAQCISGNCVECSSNANCAHFPSLPVCDTSLNPHECVAGGSPPPPGPTGPVKLPNPLKCTDIVCLIELVIKFLFNIALPIVVLMIIIAAFLFMTAAGNPQKISQAKTIILYTLVGLLLILIARGLIAALEYILGGKTS